MPTYDYECRECGHEFEHFQSITAGALRKCPSCGKLRLRRLIGTGAGIIFKGSGFYETDYKRRGMPSTAGTDRGQGESGSSSDNGKASSDASSDAGTSSKSETKAKSKTGEKRD